MSSDSAFGSTPPSRTSPAIARDGASAGSSESYADWYDTAFPLLLKGLRTTDVTFAVGLPCASAVR